MNERIINQQIVFAIENSSSRTMRFPVQCGFCGFLTAEKHLMMRGGGYKLINEKIQTKNLKKEDMIK